MGAGRLGAPRRARVLPRQSIYLSALTSVLGLSLADFAPRTLKEIGAVQARRRWRLPFSEDALSLLLWAAPATEVDATPLSLSGSSRLVTRRMHNSPVADDADRLVRSLLLGAASGRPPSVEVGVKEP